MAINNMATINRPSGVSGIEGSDGHGVANSLSEKVPVDREAKMQGPLNNEAALHMEHEKDSSKRAFSEHCPSSYKMAAEFTLQATDPKERSKYEPEYRNASLGTSVTAFSPLVDYDAPKVLQEVFVDKVQNYIYPHDRPLPAFGVRNGTREDLDGVSGKDRAVEESDVNFSIMRLDGSRSIYDESPNNVFAVDDKVNDCVFAASGGCSVIIGTCSYRSAPPTALHHQDRHGMKDDALSARPQPTSPKQKLVRRLIQDVSPTSASKVEQIASLQRCGYLELCKDNQLGGGMPRSPPMESDQNTPVLVNSGLFVRNAAEQGLCRQRTYGSLTRRYPLPCASSDSQPWIFDTSAVLNKDGHIISGHEPSHGLRRLHTPISDCLKSASSNSRNGERPMMARQFSDIIELITDLVDDIRSKKILNVDSPSFTPTGLASAGTGSAITSRAASALPFTPRATASGTATPITQIEEPLPFNPSHIREFTPQNYDTTSMNGASLDQQTPYDPFTMPSAPSNVQTAQFNPYLDDNSTLAGSSTGYYPAQTPYPTAAQPLQYHLYAPIGPHKEDLLAYQRTAHDFFMPEKIREELQRKSEATLQVMPNSQLPTLDHYHSLVPLDTTHHKNVAVFGYPSWVYKAQSSKNGRFYCLRRIEGYRLSNEKAIRTVKDWKRVNCGGVVSVIDAFTTRVFGDASIIFVYDYHPLSKTLVETHFTNTNRYGGRATSTIAEQVIWGYIVQIATAIKNVHNANLAVRCMEPSKIILTAKSRIRFSACSILDVVRYEAQKPMSELQQEDFIHFGKLVLSLASNSLAPQQGAIDQLSRLYTPELRDTVIWLLTPTPATQPKSIDDFLRGIATHVVASFDSSLHAEDTLASELYRELENGRLARLLMKLGTINDRPEYDDRTMAETSDRVQLAMFRDYVFHQVDANGNPVIDLGHIISCLNKLDAGVDEKILLTSRNEQNVYVVSYKELKRWVGAAFGELTKASRQGGRGI